MEGVECVFKLSFLFLCVMAHVIAGCSRRRIGYDSIVGKLRTSCAYPPRYVVGHTRRDGVDVWVEDLLIPRHC